LWREALKFFFVSHRQLSLEVEKWPHIAPKRNPSLGSTLWLSGTLGFREVTARFGVPAVPSATAEGLWRYRGVTIADPQ
jgi:hypothetical protein